MSNYVKERENKIWIELAISEKWNRQKCKLKT